jgi:hypothetical protein
VRQAAARYAESGEKDSVEPPRHVSCDRWLGLIIICFFHVVGASQTVKASSPSDKDTTSFSSGTIANVSRIPSGWPCRSMQEADSKSNILLSLDDTTAKWSGPINANEMTDPRVLSTLADVSGVLIDQMWTFPTRPTEATRRLLGENAMQVAAVECPVYSLNFKPVATCQILMLLSVEPEARRVPLGEYATE